MSDLGSLAPGRFDEKEHKAVSGHLIELSGAELDLIKNTLYLEREALAERWIELDRLASLFGCAGPFHVPTPFQRPASS